MTSVFLRAASYAALLCLLLPAARGQDTITVDPAVRFQTIEGIGTNYPAWITVVVDWMALPATQDLLVDDLGLSMLRMELDPDVLPLEVADPAAIDCANFQQPTRAMNYVNLAKLYKTRYPDLRVIGTLWSPPGWMKVNGRSAGGDKATNIPRQDRLPHIAKYIAEWCRWMKETWNTPLYAVGIQNELLFDEPYNSCIYDPASYVEVLRQLGRHLAESGTEVKIYGPEHMTHDSFKNNEFIRAAMTDRETKTYFSASASHGYVDGIAADTDPTSASAFWKSAVLPYGLQYWMTETSGESPDWVGARAVAEKMHQAFTGGNASAYVYWSISDKDAGSKFSLRGANTDNPKYHAFKMYSHWVRPGAVRVQAQVGAGATELDASSFLDPREGALTIVLINRSTAQRTIRIDLTEAGGLTQFSQARSSATENSATLEPIALTPGTAGAASAEITLPADSIATLHGSGGDFEQTTFVVEPETLNAWREGGLSEITVTPSPAAAWSVLSKTTWIKVKKGAYGTGRQTVQLQLEANETGSERSGMVMVAGQPYSVTQLAASAPVTIFNPPGTEALSGGIKRNGLGYLWDGQYPFVYFWAGGWVWIAPEEAGENNGYLFYRFASGQWGWTRADLYPNCHWWEDGWSATAQPFGSGL